MIQLVRTTSQNTDFLGLVKLLDEDLSLRNGENQTFYSQFNRLHLIKNVVVAYVDDLAVGCGAFKEYSIGVAEVKRMFVLPEFRGKGIAFKVLAELETWAVELNYHTLILETGKAQIEAIKLYIRNNYDLIPNYGQYENVDSSVCMKKVL